MFFESPDSYRLATRAAEEAAALGHSYMGPEHLILALLDPSENTPALRALWASGADHSKLRSALVAESRESPTPDHGISPTAGSYQMIGRAEGLAISARASEVSAEHLLLALLLHSTDSYIALCIQQAGGSREAVWVELTRRQADVPDVELPPLRGAPLPN